MSYATLLVNINADHGSRQLIGVAAGLADKFSAKLIGLSSLAIMPPLIAPGVVIVDNASQFDLPKMRATLADAGRKFEAAAGANRKAEWRSAIDRPRGISSLPRSACVARLPLPSSVATLCALAR